LACPTSERTKENSEQDVEMETNILLRTYHKSTTKQKLLSDFYKLYPWQLNRVFIVTIKENPVFKGVGVKK
jgi:hypothetical protein